MSDVWIVVSPFSLADVLPMVIGAILGLSLVLGRHAGESLGQRLFGAPR
jgi:hypothetical protein